MRLAILQPVTDERSRRCPYRDDVATLGAALRARHHAVTLIVLETCDEPDPSVAHGKRAAGTGAHLR